MRRTPRAALHDPLHSAWRKLYHSRKDSALITLTGFDFRTFKWLARMFTPIYNTYSPHTHPDGQIERIGDPRGRR
jgi:hypothetical protein